MKAYLDCVPCAMRQALEASRMATDDEKKQKEALKQVSSKLSEVDWDGNPLNISHTAIRIVSEVTSVDDPYKDLKDEFNEKAMDMYPELRKLVSDSENKLKTATKLSILGNVIDFGPDREFVLEEVVEENLEKEFEIDFFNDFERELEESERIIYLSDNTGEIVFDKLLLSELDDKEIEFFVKGSPILNDAMREDAELVGIDEMAEISEIENLDSVSEEMKNRLGKADLVISKGQANYEAFSEVNANIFFLLMVKCPLIGEDIGAEEGDMIVKWSTG